MQQPVGPAVRLRPPPQELVPVQLALGSGRDWVLWPVTSVDEDLLEFSEGLVRDLGAPLQLHRAVADAVRQQVADWVANVPPPVSSAEPRRELVRLDLVLGGAVRLRDQFWWDLHACQPTPEEFAAELCADLGLDPGHGAAVAAAIRIELGKLRRSAPTSLQLPTPRIAEGMTAAAARADGASAADGLLSVFSSSCLREPEQWQEWGPSVHMLTPEERRTLQAQQLAIQQRQQEQLAARLAARQQAELERVRQQAQAQVQQEAEQQVQADASARQQTAASAQHAQQQQQAGSAGGGGGGGAPSSQQQQRQQRRDADEQPARRQLRPRRANRLAELLRQEEEASAGDSSGSDSEGASKRPAPAATAVMAHATGSRVSEEYQPGEDSLLQGEMQEAAEREAGGKRARQRRRTSGGGGGGGEAAVHSKHAPGGVAAAAAAHHQQQQQQQQQHSLLAQRQHRQQQQQQAAPGMQTAPGMQAAPDMQAQQMQGVLGPAASGSMMPLLSGAGMGSGGGVGMVGSGGGVGMLGPGMVPVQPAPSGMVPTPALGPPLLGQAGPGPGMGLGSGAPGGGAQMMAPTPPPQPQPPHFQMVSAAIVHYARELGIGEHKIQSFLSKTAAEQLALFRTLHQLVQQSRARQQEAAALGQAGPGVAAGGPAAGLRSSAGGAAGMPPMPAGMGMPPGPPPGAPMAHPMMGGPMGGFPAGPQAPPLLQPSMGMLPQLSVPPLQEQLAPPASQFANLFSEMFD